MVVVDGVGTKAKFNEQFKSPVEAVFKVHRGQIRFGGACCMLTAVIFSLPNLVTVVPLTSVESRVEETLTKTYLIVAVGNMLWR